MARIVHELFGRPLGWSFESILSDLNINERTLQRYVNKFTRSFVDWNGKPLIEVFMRGDRRVLRLAQHPQAPDSNAYKAASLFFTITVLRFLDGTILKEGVDDLWDRLRKQLPRPQADLLCDVERKFFAVPSTPKSYKDFDDQLDFILRALLHGWRLEIEYKGHGEPRVHQFDPYTLIAYKGGLYMAGRSNLSDQLLYLAVERMRHVGFVVDRDGRNERFVMPPSWHPERHTEGAFGIVDGPETEVELLICNADTEMYLRSRAIHPTQKFHPRSDGKTTLTMKVRGTTELKNWILGFGPWLKVLKPRHLRDEVAALFTKASRLYGTGKHSVS
jgi:proteasome accessory factor B